MSEEKNRTAGGDIVWKDRKHFMWFPFSFTKYKIQNSRLYKDMGLFTTVSDEVMLYRVVDITMVRTFTQKLFGTGTLLVATRVNREEIVKLENIKNPKATKDLISDLVEQERLEKHVIGKEFFGGHPGGPAEGHEEMPACADCASDEED
ncbi:MAG: PH domain-containing protein [Lachnospiraceae bacterium]|nr:PH domain-containing protein [Lachnospiraceae bacterium]